MGNRGSHSADVAFLGVHLDFLFSRYTAKYQPLDLITISQREISCRALLLGASITIMLLECSGNNTFTAESNRGLWRLAEGQLPYIKINPR